jgi:hypothetical protein
MLLTILKRLAKSGEAQIVQGKVMAFQWCGGPPPLRMPDGLRRDIRIDMKKELGN